MCVPRVLRHWIVLVIIALTAAPALAAERRVALVIGNAQYERGRALPVATANAATVGEALRHVGFEVTTATNQKHRGLVAALSHFADEAKGADVALVYYSGLVLGADGKGYVVPVDANLASEQDIPLDTEEIDQIFQTMRAAGRGVFLLDPLVPNAFASELARTAGEGGRSVQPVGGVPGPADLLLVAYAHQPGKAPVPSRGSGPGPFAAALAQEFVKPGAELRRALSAVAVEVAARTGGAQRPWVRDRIGADVVLVPETATPQTSAAPPVAPQSPALAFMVPEPKVEPLEGTFVAIRDTNVRAGPDNRAPVLRTVRGDTPVTATGQVRKGGWTRVTVDGQQGFIYSANLRRADETASTPSTPSNAADGPMAPGPHRVMRPAILFDRPAVGARGLRDLPAGAAVTVVEAVPGSNWVRVRDDGSEEGYLTMADLSAGGEAPPPIHSGNADMAPAPSESSEAVALSQARALAQPVEEAVRTARAAASSGERAAVEARGAAQRAAEAQARARAAAETARAGTMQAWVHQFPNGDVYEGEWTMVAEGGGQHMQKSGYGVYRFADGQRYEGGWRNDQMAGFGVITYRSGDRYDGTFQAGRPDGAGVFRYANGDGYAGEVRVNRPDGNGELNYANGDRYQGRVSDRQPDGFGALTMNGTGGRHVGRFRAGVPNGPGMATSYDGAQLGGTWREGRLVNQ